MTDTNELIHEIEESIKQDRLSELWEQYGAYLIAGVLIVVLSTGFITGWRSWDDKTNAYNTSVLLDALDQENKAEALSAVMGTFRPGQKSLALFTSAGLLMQDGRYDAALTKYKRGAKDETLPEVFRELASLMAIKLEWVQNSESVKPEQLLRSLEPIWSDEESPWQWHARMQAATILAHGLNDYNSARSHLMKVINSSSAPETLSTRAKALNHVYGLKRSLGGNDKEQPEG